MDQIEMYHIPQTAVRERAYKYVFSSAMGINRSVYLEEMCILLFRHEIRLRDVRRRNNQPLV